jgi:hypothetical protein
MLTGMAFLVFSAVGILPRFVGILMAMLCLIVGGSILSLAGKIGRELEAKVGSRASVKIWGSTPPALEGPQQLQSVRAIGAGLHLYFVAEGSSKARHIKIAQPTEMTVDSSGCMIARAKYVQLDDVTIKPQDANATAIELKWM